jgi:threonine dehydrogenase-like Zn-dependent dehydrogenase
LAFNAMNGANNLLRLLGSMTMRGVTFLGDRKLQLAEFPDPAPGPHDVAAIQALTHGAGAAMTLDTSGAAEGRLTAVRGTHAWGVACFVGEGGNVTLEVSPDMLRKQLTIMGSWTFSTVVQAECARFIADRNIDVEHLFTDRWQLAQADEAYRLFDRQTSGKGVFLI